MYVTYLLHRSAYISLCFILFFFLFFLLSLFWIQAVDMVKKTPAYKNRLRALELKRSGGTTNKKKSNKQMDKYAAYSCLIFDP